MLTEQMGLLLVLVYAGLILLFHDISVVEYGGARGSRC